VEVSITNSSFRVSALFLVAIAVGALMVVLLASHKDASALSTRAVPGTTIKVNTNADESNADGDCSLREAIQAADTNAAVDACDAGSATQRDAIHFALGNRATITLGSRLPIITDASGLNINGLRAKITVSGNDAVQVFEVSSGAKLTLARLTVADGNTSDFGGGIENRGGALTVTNSTFSGNSADISGGGIFNGSGETATLRNTIVANSPSGGNCSNLGTLTDGGYNIDDGTSCGFSQANNSMPSEDPLLDPDGLQNNGGPTKTIALMNGSPAINAIPQGTNGCGTDITTDQRGVSRPKGSGCEVGAFEKKQ
jgi:CSLREA domain-containing protein